MTKAANLNKLVIGKEGVRCNPYGGRQVPFGYAVMKLGAKRYYFIKYDGEQSDVSDHKTVWNWIMANKKHDERQS